MFRRIVLAVGVLVAAATTSMSAQAGKVEVSGYYGWVFSDGVETTTPVLAGDGHFYDRVDPLDSGIFGFSAGVMVTDNVELGFLYGLQSTKLQAEGTAERELGDISVTGYHGYISYNFGEPDAALRPFFLFGLGATNFGESEFTTIGGLNLKTSSETQFSTTIAGGLKYFFNPKVAVRVTGRLTPTYIKTDTAGWWCDPYWGCYLVGDPQYSNQFELSGGVTFRF